MNIYYVYAYINKRTRLPYYIGKGKGNRLYASHGRITVPTDKKYIVLLETNLTNVGACALERRYIKWYGKKVDNTGVLLNLTDGGEGGLGGNQYKRTPDICQRISETNKRKGINFVNHGATAAAKKVNLGKKQSKEHISKRLRFKKVCVDGIIYTSGKEAARALGVSSAAISNRIKRGHSAWLI